MQAQKTDFDEFEEDIVNEFRKLNGIPLQSKSIKWWTKKVMNAVGKASKERKYKIYASKSKCDQSDGEEWLYDLTCLEEENGYLKSIPLVLESEWKNAKGKYESRIRDDFEKLLVSRAGLRVMVLEVKSDEEEKKVVNQLLQYVQKCQHSKVGDRYLFACRRQVKKKWVFDCSVYVVKE